MRKRRRRGQSGQSAIEYVGLVAVVVAIVGSLLATGLGPTIAQEFRTQVCKITGGENCGGGAPRAQDDQGGPGDAGNGRPASGDPRDGSLKTQTELDYEKALKELQDAQAAEKSDRDKAIEAAKELAKILAEELGITDALDCITKGDMGACTETLINVLLSIVGGAVGKLAAKYGAPWKWKKAVELVKRLRKHGGDLYDGLKGLIKNRKRVSDAEDKLADAKKKLDAEKQKKPEDEPEGKPEDKPDDRPTTCPRHSFLPGTPVLLADGRRIPIETVRTGDRVKATDPYSGSTATRRVTKTITTYDDKDFTRLTVRTVAGTAVVEATDTHPFWLTGRGEWGRWANAGDIRPGERLRGLDGTAPKVLTARHYTAPRTTHDLTVAETHTYYVLAGRTPVLVHNQNDCGPLDGEREYDVYDPVTKNRITDIDHIDGGVLWEEKSALFGDETWLTKQVDGKLTKYLEARKHMEGYEQAPIGFRFTNPSVDPRFRAALEQRIQKLREDNPGLDIRLEFTG
ncbi:Hint domain-containing protein [Streptomyces sp. NBC_01142]|uniref:Hint domain-containing protein n=1 Tax=Streptomyces sp. NBC_01142 TaxID=2975865 RepID=UPI00224C7CF8|nr:Hint domain-containing protein [Streptomyces sp. NBC_01142]MCX4819083.1 Hint domain-containing protein [Streptomyces sp. NBC_01142]